MARVAPTIVGTASVGTPRGGGTTADGLVFTVPGGFQVGDLIVAAVTNQQSPSAAPDITAPGFTRVGIPFPTSGQGRITGFWVMPIVSLATAPSTVTFSSDNSFYRYAGVMVIVRNVDLVDMVAGYSNSYPGIPSGSGADTMDYPVTGPTLALFLGANEATAGVNPIPTATPSGYSPLGMGVSSEVVTGTRTALWLGYRGFTDDTVPAARMEWEAVSGPRVQSIALRGRDAATPVDPNPGTPGETIDGQFIIQLRRGTASEIAASNVILADGELGLNKTTRQLIVGNGVGRASTLPTIGGGGSGVIVVPDIESIPAGTPAGTLVFKAD